jgi:hypothetical protein
LGRILSYASGRHPEIGKKSIEVIAMLSAQDYLVAAQFVV